MCNEDGAGRVTAAGRNFTIERPQASLHARVTSAGASTLATGRLALPESGGVYPYAEISSASAKEHAFVTVCTAAPRGENHGGISVTHELGAWRIAGTHRGQNVSVAIAAAAGLSVPVITL